MNTSIINFCAEECARQKSGELSVARYITAWDRLLRLNMSILTVPDIFVLAHTIEPDMYDYGYRRVPVTFADGSRALPHMLIKHTMRNLFDSLTLLSPEEVYQEFETIHPFVDGNGRLGALLYNYLRGSLEYPVSPPEYKSNWCTPVSLLDTVFKQMGEPVLYVHDDEYYEMKEEK